MEPSYSKEINWENGDYAMFWLLYVFPFSLSCMPWGVEDTPLPQCSVQVNGDKYPWTEPYATMGQRLSYSLYVFLGILVTAIFESYLNIGLCFLQMQSEKLVYSYPSWFPSALSVYDFIGMYTETSSFPRSCTHPFPRIPH